MPEEEKKFATIDEVRAAFYPESASLLDLGADDIIGLPLQLSDDAFRAVQQVVEQRKP